MFWRYELKNECKVRTHTKNNEVVKVNGHPHGASAVSMEVITIKTSIELKAEETLEVPSSIINACIENSSHVAQAALPNADAITKIVRKLNQITSAPANPESSRVSDP